MVHRFGLVAVLLAMVSIVACSDSTGPETQEHLQSFSLAVPSDIVIGKAFTIAVTAVGSQGGTPYTGFSGTVSLSYDNGTVTPSEIALTNGTGSVDVVIGGGVAGTLTASAGGASGSAALAAAYQGLLEGNPDDPANEHIPEFTYTALEADYDESHPQLAGILVSPRVILLTLATGTTVAEANALLSSRSAGIAGGLTGDDAVAPGLLVLKLPTTTHAEMEQALTTLRSDPIVRNVIADIAVEGTVITKNGPDVHPNWIWRLAPGGGNWGLETIRVPQMWNLNDAVRKRGTTTITGMIDGAVDASHPDLAVTSYAGRFGGTHGTHVAGIIAAIHDNELGVDGVNPFATLRAWTSGASGSGRIAATRIQWGTAMTNSIRTALREPGIRVLNMSLGFNWYIAKVDQDADPLAQGIANATGFMLKDMLDNQRARGPLPLICAAAGNESNQEGWDYQDARWESPMANAAIVHAVPEILIVEAVGYSSSHPSWTEITSFSCVGGAISAPGASILSTFPMQSYEYEGGTSMATPHVAGLAGYLLALEPGLSAVQVRDLLTTTSVAVDAGSAPSAANRIDAFAAAIDIDRVLGGDIVARALVDVDDGTRDGNLRVDPVTGDEVTNLDFDNDGGRGDGTIDMSDFRAWRDWYLQATQAPGLDLDGPAGHIKKDLNGDRVVGSAEDENIFPRGDFNGDGIIDLNSTAFMPGTFQKDMTDLDVLRALLDDPHYTELELLLLIDSGDIHVFAAYLMARPDVDKVITQIWRSGISFPIEERDHSSGGYEIFTVPVDDYSVYTFALSAAQDTLCRSREHVTVDPGTDAYITPGCVQMEITADFPQTVEPGTPAPLAVTVGFRNDQGGVDYRAGVQIDLLATGGTVSPQNGVTDASGTFDAEGTLVSPATNITIFITVTDPQSGESKTISVNANALVTGGLALAQYSGANADASASADGVDDGNGSNQPGPPYDAVNLTATATADGPRASGSATGSTAVTYTVDASDVFTAFTFNLSTTASGSSGAEVDGCGGANAGAYIVFEVVDGPVTYAFRGTMSQGLAGDEAHVRIRWGLSEGGWGYPHVYETGSSFDTTGTLSPGVYMVQAWCNGSACGDNNSASLSGRFEILASTQSTRARH